MTAEEDHFQSGVDANPTYLDMARFYGVAAQAA